MIPFDKSEPRMRLLLELMLVHVAYATSQPSLARVAAVLFMRVPYDDRDRIRSDMKRNSHTHHPLFRGWSNGQSKSLRRLDFKGPQERTTPGSFYVQQLEAPVRPLKTPPIHPRAMGPES